MEFTQEGMDLLTFYEGCKLVAYKCPKGVWTIGYGTTKGVKAGMVITPAIAQTLLLSDIQEIEDFMSTNIACRLNKNEYSALICLIYNIGEGAFRMSKMLRLLNQGKKSEVPKEFLRWNRIDKRVSKGLTARREAEKNLFLKV